MNPRLLIRGRALTPAEARAYRCSMRVLGPNEVVAALDFPDLIEALRRTLRCKDIVKPKQQCHAITLPAGRAGRLEIAPAWQDGRNLGIEVTTVFPDETACGATPALGSYLLLDGCTGRLLAFLDGPALTARRTAATSALAATYLARPDCERLLMIGTGALASHLVEAHASVRPIRKVLVWDGDFDKAMRWAQRMTRRTLQVAATDDLQRAVTGAEVICCAVATAKPLLLGHWLPLGTHIDLIPGPATDACTAADDETLRRASVFVEARPAALAGAGDGDTAIGAIRIAEIDGDLVELCRGSHPGRQFDDEITLFRSGDLGFLNLAAAQLALESSTT